MLKTLLLLLTLSLIVHKSYAQQDLPSIDQYQIDHSEFDPNNMLIVRLELGGHLVLSDAVVGYEHRNSVFLSFNEFVESLDFPIHADANTNKYEGWFIAKNKKFIFNTQDLTSMSDSKEHKVDPNWFKIFDDELFVDIKLLQLWFPIKMKFNPFNQLINIISLDPLPVENKVERERRWNEFYQKKNLKTKEDIQVRKAPYRLATLPFADIRYRYDYEKSDSSEEDYTSQLGILATGDLFHLNHHLFANINKGDGVSDVRLKSGKKDIDPVLLGPLKAREFAIGDIYNQQLPLIAGSKIGKGAMVSNYPEHYVSEFDSVIIRGDIQNDWQVELYRNKSLIDFQQATDDGIYEFTDVPLISGLNIMKLIFYGPNGEIREEERRYLMDPTLAKRNKFHYRFSVNQHEQSLIRANKKEDDFGEDEQDGKSRYVGEFEYGLAKNLGLLGNLAYIPLEDDDGEHRSYSTVGLKSVLFGVDGRVELVNDLTKDLYALQTSLKTKIRSYDFSLKHAKFEEDFNSEVTQSFSDALINETSFRVNGPIKIKSRILRLSLKTDREYFSSKKEKLKNKFSLSFPASKKVNITQDINYDFDDRVTTDNRNITTGRTFFNYRILRNLIARSVISYNISPTEELTNSNLNLNYILKNKVNLGLNVTHQFANSTQEDSTNYVATISKIFQQYRASFGANYNDIGSYGFNATLSFAFGYSPKYDTGVISNAPMAKNGSAVVKVFLDEDNNHKHDDGEELFQGIDFKVDGRKLKESTNDKGTMLIGNLTSNRKVKIEIDPKKLQDPYLAPVIKKVSLISHPGSVDYIDFPIVNTGEIEGTVSLFKGKKLVGASNVLLELVNESGEVVKTTLSSYDGFYLFDTVLIGKYQVRISKEQSQRLGLNIVEGKEVELSNDNSLLIGIDFTIK